MMTPLPLKGKPSLTTDSTNLKVRMDDKFLVVRSDPNALQMKFTVNYECSEDKPGLNILKLTFDFEGCDTPFKVQFAKSCSDQTTSGVLMESMSNLVIQENNKLFERPMLY